MLKEAIEKIVSLATPETYTIGGDTYSTNRSMMRVEPQDLSQILCKLQIVEQKGGIKISGGSGLSDAALSAP